MSYAEPEMTRDDVEAEALSVAKIWAFLTGMFYGFLVGMIAAAVLTWIYWPKSH